MTRKPISIQELIDLKPSMDNPIELVCDDGDYQKELFRIKVVGVYKERISVINTHDMLQIIYDANLHHYPSFKQPKKRNLEVFYEAISFFGHTYFTNENNYLRVIDKACCVENMKGDFLKIPNGRKLIYDHDTRELLAWDEELMK